MFPGLQGEDGKFHSQAWISVPLQVAENWNWKKKKSRMGNVQNFLLTTMGVSQIRNERFQGNPGIILAFFTVCLVHISHLLFFPILCTYSHSVSREEKKPNPMDNNIFIIVIFIEGFPRPKYHGSLEKSLLAGKACNMQVFVRYCRKLF